MPPSVSVVVNNFNYGGYLSTAIESALAQDYPSVEVVVVDDGSTDDSRQVIARYDGRVTAVLKENGGQASAMNAGFTASQGDWVLFLDADDFLAPAAASSVVSAATPDCAKVQFRMSVVDESGKRVGAFPAPGVCLPTGDVVPLIAAAGRYPTPVTSGNAYRRSVLEELLPIPEQQFRISADGYLNALAPFYGPVVSLDRELAAYRRHSSNRWAFTAGVTAPALRAHVEHDLLREQFVQDVARARGRQLPADLAMRDWSHVLHRLSHLRLDLVHHPAPGDRPVRLAITGLRATRCAPDLGAVERAFYGVLFLVLGVIPRPLVQPTVGWILGSRQRPLWMRRLKAGVRRLTARAP